MPYRASLRGYSEHMSELLKKERELVLPGEAIVSSLDYLPGKNCFREGNAISSKKVGVVAIANRVISVIPLNAVYMPRVGDMVIGQVVDITSNGWIIDIKAPYEAYLPLSGIREFVDTTKTDLSRIFAKDDLVYAKVAIATPYTLHVSLLDLKARKLRGGRILPINPAKVPRLIGKEGSMITMIKDRAGCRISVGQNGLVWVEGGNDALVLKAIELIENEPFAEGLTERIDKLLGGASPGHVSEPMPHEASVPRIAPEEEY